MASNGKWFLRSAGSFSRLGVLFLLCLLKALIHCDAVRDSPFFAGSADGRRHLSELTDAPVSSNSTLEPSVSPSSTPSTQTPSISPSTTRPSFAPSASPSTPKPSLGPSTHKPSSSPSTSPSTPKPSQSPSTLQPSGSPSARPSTNKPSSSPSGSPLPSHPSEAPSTAKPSQAPSRAPLTSIPTQSPSVNPSTSRPSQVPTTDSPSVSPNKQATSVPSNGPATSNPSRTPSARPSTPKPSQSPITSMPSFSPSVSPTTTRPSRSPSRPTMSPSRAPTTSPTLIKRSHPSLLIMMADDLGYGDVGYLGGYARTPNIDSLASSQHSLRLDNFHAASSVCSPSRAAMISGRNPERDCVPGPIGETRPGNFRDGMQSLAAYAKRAGLKTAFYGKWHLGTKTPQVVGFDDFVYSQMNTPTYDPACFCQERRCVDSCRAKGAVCFRSSGRRCGSRLSTLCDLGSYRSASEFNPYNWFCNLKAGGLTRPRGTLEFPRGTSAAEHVASFANSFLRGLVQTQPFLMYVFFNEPHDPFIASAAERARCFDGTSCTPDVRNFGGVNSAVVNYYAAIHVMDRAIGTILTALAETSRGHDTMIVFTSDNGYEAPNNGGLQFIPTRYLRGFKRLVYEGGIRVPGILHYRPQIIANAITRQPVSMLDIPATFAGMLFAISPGLGAFASDGQSLLTLMSQPSSWTRSKPFVLCMPLTEIQNQPCVTFAYFEGKYKVVVTNNDANRPEIFDIVADTGETSNLRDNLGALTTTLVNNALGLRNQVLGEFRASCRVIPPRRRRRG